MWVIQLSRATSAVKSKWNIHRPTKKPMLRPEK